MRLARTLSLAVALCAMAASPMLFAQQPQRIRVILDTDANNELDDQHAIAYLLFNGDVFDVEGITVNRTRAGGGIDQHVTEAQRVVRLCGLDSKIDVLRGADGSFERIRPKLNEPDFDGAEAVDFIIRRAKAADQRRLVLLPVGKLTNIALALAKEPSIAPRVRIVWLGSNYPDPGEYNQVNDEPALQYLLEADVEFEIAIVRYGKPSGTDAVRATVPEIREKMAGKGPQVSPPVPGRHGGQFRTFGDYSINLFENIRLHGSPPSRALFDMAAVAIVKNPAWATATRMPAPLLKDGRWTERPGNERKIVLWEDFDRDAIMNDFYDRMENYRLAGNAPPNPGPGVAENAPPPIIELDRVRPRRSVWEGATWRKPIVLKSAKDAADHFEADALADLLRQVDFGKQFVLLFAWRGSGQDRLEVEVTESDPEQITFIHQPGRTRDLVAHARAYALRSNVTWRVR